MVVYFQSNFQFDNFVLNSKRNTIRGLNVFQIGQRKLFLGKARTRHSIIRDCEEQYLEPYFDMVHLNIPMASSADSGMVNHFYRTSDFLEMREKDGGQG